MIMIGNGQWVTTRDMASAQLFMDEIHMQEDLREERSRRRRELFDYWWSRVRSLFATKA
ncbi:MULTISPECIES: hypothetical protein [Brevibacterium]|nr:hypothetical protein [Brevibacterium sandarakinum]